MEYLQLINASLDKFQSNHSTLLFSRSYINSREEVRTTPFDGFKIEELFYIGVKLTPTNELLFILLEVELSSHNP